MRKNIVCKLFKINGMTCTGCELRLESKLNGLKGVLDAKADYTKSIIEITFDETIISVESLILEIESLDYEVIKISKKQSIKKESHEKFSIKQFIAIGSIVIMLFLLLQNTNFNFIPQINQNMSYGILFVVGLITSLHCVAMCGGINLSQCVTYHANNESRGKIQNFKPSILYNLGRVISYTMIGGVIGAIGSVFAFSGATKGLITILSGVFMLIMGLNMLNVFPWLRKINPSMPKFIGKRLNTIKNGHGPFYIGLLNGLMPCGPLQAMQLYALGTGSFLTGALSMMAFSLGTVPLMFGLGALSSILSSKFTHKMLKVSAVLVLALGLVMVGRGFNLFGITVPNFTNASAQTTNVSKVDQKNHIQVIKTNFESGRYVPIIVQKGIPVKWIINVKKGDINGCNNPVTIPKYNIEKKLVPGENVITFTPQEEETITYTCWMGMIRSTIKVVANTSNLSKDDLTSTAPSEPGLGGGCCAYMKSFN